MERNIKIEAITLKKIQLGESNLGVSLLTGNDEVLFVMVFGAKKPKSKFFGAVNPFVESTWDLYYDPVKEYYRAKDVSILKYNSEIQLSLESFYTGTLFLEIILKSQGSEGVYNLLKICLQSLIIGGNHKLILIQFILRLIKEQGLLPSFTHCSNCEKELNREPLYYNGDFEMVCGTCFRGIKNFELNPGMLLYCSKTPDQGLESALKIGLAGDSVEQLKKILIQLIKTYTGGKLLTLNSSNGLI